MNRLLLGKPDSISTCLVYAIIRTRVEFRGMTIKFHSQNFNIVFLFGIQF